MKAPAVNEARRAGVNRGIGPARRERGSTRTFGSVLCACVLVSPLYYKPSMKKTATSYKTRHRVCVRVKLGLTPSLSWRERTWPRATGKEDSMCRF